MWKSENNNTYGIHTYCLYKTGRRTIEKNRAALLTWICIIQLCIFFQAGEALGQSGNITEANNFSKGMLTVDTGVDSFYVVIDDDFKDARYIANRDTITVQAGRRTIRIVKKYYLDTTIRTTVIADSVQAIKTNLLPFGNLSAAFKDKSSYPRIFWGGPLAVKTERDAKLYYRGNLIGTGLGVVDTTGTIEITSELPSGERKTETFVIDRERNSFAAKQLYHRPKRRLSRILALLPGTSQIYQKEKLKGYLILGATVVGGSIAYSYHQQFKETYEDYLDTSARYRAEQDPATALQLGDQAEAQLHDARYLAKWRDGLVYGTLGVYLFNIVDAWIKPENGYRKALKIDPYIDFNKNIGLRYRF